MQIYIAASFSRKEIRELYEGMSRKHFNHFGGGNKRLYIKYLQ